MMNGDTDVRGGVAICIIGAMVWLAGCGTESGTGLLQVFWKVGGTTCESVQVTDVVIHVLGEGEDILSGTRAFDCESGAEGVLLEDVPTGTYTVAVEGLDQDGNAYYWGELSGVVVTGDVQTDVLPPINLELKKALVVVTWEFKNGKLCSSNGVSMVEVNAFDTTSNRVFFETYDCDPFDDPVIEQNKGILIDDLRGNEEIQFDLFGMDASEVRMFRGHGEVTTIPGGLPGGEPQDMTIILSECVEPSDCQ